MIKSKQNKYSLSFCKQIVMILWTLGLPVLLPASIVNQNLPDSISQKIDLASTDSIRFRAILEKCVWLRDYKNELAEEAYFEALNQATRAKDTFWMGKIESSMGVYYSFNLQYDKSLTHYFNALSLFEAIHNQKEIAGVYHNIAMVLNRNGEPNKGVYYLWKAIKINQSISNNDWLIKNYGELGFYYEDFKKYDSAIIINILAKQLAQKINNPSSIVSANSSLGRIYIVVKQYDLAEPLLREANNLTHKYNLSPYKRSNTAMLLGNLLQKTGKLVEAEKLLIEAINIKKQNNISDNLGFCYKVYSELEVRKGNYQKALSYFKEYKNLGDSVLSDEKQKALTQYQIKYESEKKEKENIILKKDNQIKQQQIYNLYIIIILLFAFISYYYYSYFQKKKANILIASQKEDLSLKNQQLNDLLTEKDNIIATVSHDYRSPLGRLRAISDLLLLNPENLTEKQQKLIRKIPEILREATHLIDDLMDVSHLDKLSLDTKSENFYPEELLMEIIENYEPWLLKKRLIIQKEFSASSQAIYADKAAFQRIFDNLLSNAIKYSYPETKITISTSLTANATRIWVKDEGQGFTAEDKEKIFSSFQRLSAQPIEVGNAYGLGLSIIKKLSEIVGATITLEDSEKGACFLWELPNKPLTS